MIVIKPITPLNASLFRAIRLRALEDAPHAFTSTYAQESQLADSEWLARAERMNGERGAGFLAMDGENACGLVGVFIDQNDLSRALLVSMWTAPTYRRQGVGRLLVEEVLHWSQLRRVRTVLLMVTANNESAIRFYERLGFTPTGRTEPYPHNPAVLDHEMSRQIP